MKLSILLSLLVASNAHKLRSDPIHGSIWSPREQTAEDKAYEYKADLKAAKKAEKHAKKVLKEAKEKTKTKYKPWPPENEPTGNPLEI